MIDRSAADWEDLARREPYFAVLTSEGLPGVEANRAATAEFLQTGEDDMASLLAGIDRLRGQPMAMRSALDFGCGAGRLTVPLARRAATVVACDIAPTMLTHARQNVERAGFHNAAFLDSALLAEMPPGRFDFVCSLLVFQYIRPATGYAVMGTLIRLLAPHGIAALHVTFRSPPSLARFARWTRRGSQARAMQTAAPGVRTYSAVNGYDEATLERTVASAGARMLGRFPTRSGDAAGAVLIIERPGD